MHALELVREFVHHFITPAGVRRIQSLRAFRRPLLEDWMAGGLEDWRTERVGSIGRIERKNKPAEKDIAESRGPLEELFGDQ